MLEGGEACLATSSGLAAVFEAILELMGMEPGGEFVTSAHMYGNAQRLVRFTLPVMGMSASFVEPAEDVEAWEAAIGPNTRFLFVESPSNPDVFVADVPRLAKLASAHDLPLLVDSTLSSPAVFRPLEHGASVVVHSTTKYISGHSAALGGAIIGDKTFIDSLRSGHHHYIGPTMSPMTAFLSILGLETLFIRMPRCVESAQRVAEFLSEHPKVAAVNFPGLDSHPQHGLAQELFGSAGTSLMAFEIKGSQADAFRVINSLQVPCHATHLGGNQTVVVNPATTTHGSLTPEERAKSNVPDGLIRYSVGLENPADLIADLDRALSRLD
jgi:O-acetylhomoserine/O-acetylserine sulfhydrylase-like pyridoxal-dependent enzyme